MRPPVVGGPDSEGGQVTVLALGLAIVVVVLVVGVVDTSRVFLHQRALAGAADGAAAAAAQAVDLEALYTGGAGQPIPLDPAHARDAVAAYVDDADLDRRFGDLRILGVRVVADTVTVTLAAVVDLPFVLPGVGGAYDVVATASARARAG